MAIDGKGDFRRFKDTAHHLGVIEQWYAFHDKAVIDFMQSRLEENDIPYIEES